MGLISCPLSLSQTIWDSWSLEDLFMSLVQTTCLLGAAVCPGAGKSTATEGTQLGRLSSRLYLTIAQLADGPEILDILGPHIPAMLGAIGYCYAEYAHPLLAEPLDSFRHRGR